MRYIFLPLVVISLCAFNACKPGKKVWVLLPLGDTGKLHIHTVYSKVKQILPEVVLLSPGEIPALCLNQNLTRFRADKILVHLENRFGGDTQVIAITSHDISCTKGKHPDWGVMGLARRPGRVCVASSFRPARNGMQDQFYKVVWHEIGHTQGLSHCREKHCFMRDAQGKIPLKEEVRFCNRCATVLKSKGIQTSF